MKKLFLLFLLMPTLAYSQLASTPFAYHPTQSTQKVNLHLYRVNSEADDIRRAKNLIIFGTILNVTGAALAITAPKLHDDPKTVKTIKYAGLGVGVLGFAFSIPSIFVLTKNRNRYY